VISKILSFDWALLFFWIMATSLGWLLGNLIFPGLAVITAGVLVGIFQWLVLQGRVHQPWRWVLATMAGWSIGYLAAFFGTPPELEILEGTIIGLSTGIAQWVILRREVYWAGWWVLFSIMGWTTGLTLFPGILLTGTMAGALTGFALEILFRFPKRTVIASKLPG
jgi:hypothetical protein